MEVNLNEVNNQKKEKKVKKGKKGNQMSRWEDFRTTQKKYKLARIDNGEKVYAILGNADINKTVDLYEVDYKAPKNWSLKNATPYAQYNPDTDVIVQMIIYNYFQ